MSKPEQAIVATLRQQEILNRLQVKVRTWNDLRGLTKLNDDKLGFTILELLNLRQIWTIQKGEVRVCMEIERRKGMVTRFAHEPRRAGDQPV